MRLEEPTVTDHALVRFIERKMGVDVEAIRQQILTPPVKAAIRAGAKTVKMRNSRIELRIAGGKVVTIV